jgi:O-antigen/teichoic acid export membrane protein
MNEQQKGFALLPTGQSGSGEPARVQRLGEESTPRGRLAEALDVDERVRLMRDGVVNNSSLLVSGLIGIFLVPIMLRGLGAESYGLWIAALSVVGVVGLFDFGLGLSVTREVAASLNSESRSAAARFVKAARTAFFLVGAAGAILISALGLPLSRGLHLSAASQRITPTVFVLAGIAFLADRMLIFTMSVLRGLRRFDMSNLLAIVAALARALGIVALLKLGSGLLAVMVWQVVATGAAAWTGQAAVGGLEAGFRSGLGRLEWKLVRTHLPFGFASQITTIADIMLWQLVPVIVGLVLGSGWIAAYYVAQKFPTSIGPIIWSTAEALFPAVSQHQRDPGIARTREIMEVGTRWTVVLALPLCLALLMLAPELLQAWVHEVRPEAVRVLRLITAAVFMEGVAAASYQMLWGRGETRPLLIVSSSLAVTSLGLSLVLLPRMGIAGAAWGLLAPMAIAAVAYLKIATGICQVRLRDLMHTTFAGLLLPVVAFLVIGGSINHWSSPGWIGVIASALGGGGGYLVGFCLVGARVEEKVFVRKMVTAPVTVMHSAHRRFRLVLDRVLFRRNG